MKIYIRYIGRKGWPSEKKYILKYTINHELFESEETLKASLK